MLFGSVPCESLLQTDWKNSKIYKVLITEKVKEITKSLEMKISHMQQYVHVVWFIPLCDRIILHQRKLPDIRHPQQSVILQVKGQVWIVDMIFTKWTLKYKTNKSTRVGSVKMIM